MALKANRWNLKVGEIEGKEVDFAAEKDGNICYIQVAYLIEK